MLSETIPSNVPRMGAEAGYELEDAPPFHVSGYICLIIALFSPAALLGLSAVLIPAVAIPFGLFALRRHGEQVPTGTTAARVGLLLAFGFGACGIAIPWMQHVTLGGQAEKFARDYIEVIARDEAELAMELQKDYVNRFPDTMPLMAHYALNPPPEEQLEIFQNDPVNKTIRRRGPGARWRLAEPVRVYTHYGFQRADVVFEDPTGAAATNLRFTLEYKIDSSGKGQWQMLNIVPDVDKIYAPAVL